MGKILQGLTGEAIGGTRVLFFAVWSFLLLGPTRRRRQTGKRVNSCPPPKQPKCKHAPPPKQQKNKHAPAQTAKKETRPAPSLRRNHKKNKHAPCPNSKNDQTTKKQPLLPAIGMTVSQDHQHPNSYPLSKSSIFPYRVRL